MTPPSNLAELRDTLAKVLSDCDDPRKVAAAAVKTAAAGKIISSIALDLQHAHMRKETPNHPWCLSNAKTLPSAKPKKLS